MLAVAFKILLAGVVAGTIDILKKGDDFDFEYKWNKLMVSSGIKVKGDEEFTFTIIKKIDRVYGYDIIVNIPDGLTYTALEGLEEQIKISFKCHEVYMEYKRQSGTAYMKLVINPLADDTVFQPIATKPWEVYLGTTKYFKDVIVDMRTFPHAVIAGVTGAGKSLFTIQTILNIIINHSEKDVNIYLNEISDKDDFKMLKNCSCVKGYSRNLQEATKALKHIYDEMGRRNRIFNEYDDVNSLYDYNKKFPHKAMPWIYFFTDEYSLFMEDDSDTDQDDFYKKQCQAYMKKLAKLARNTGIFVFSSLQRPDRESMPALFKTNLNVVVAFKQRNGASALTVLDSYKPMELKYREAIVDFGGDQYIIYSLYINSHIIKCYLEDKKEDDHKYVDLSLHDWLVKESNKHRKDKRQNNKKQQQNNEKEIATTTENNIVSFEKMPKNNGKRGKGALE